ncbi:P-loop containing nucleoside triphosphate hydrolase protein [Exidia glandulosa HHB12029]|uniref:p-loop containing nucleoside triphosphate hydrolase protein n=1 Tax=Exidia glandulosa HHB12029 TaxID=1314781 RepID=A0A165BTH5_EXIGL|nr:P-loop containing nucleoside triphosphate hydrolase protein [Exidia glandulosa HHB12029]
MDGEPLVLQLHFAVASVLPAVTVLGALVAFVSSYSRRGKATRRTVLSNIITDGDIEEELAFDLGHIPHDGAVTEATPLLPRSGTGTGTVKSHDHARTRKSLLFVAIGALELAGRVALLVHAIRAGDPDAYIPLATSIGVWTYATLMPLFVPPARPPYPLFIIYLLSLFQAVLDVYLYGIVSTSVSASLSPVRVLYMGHLALCTLGFLLVLAMPLNPYIGKPDFGKEGPPPAMDDYATLGQWMTVNWLATVMRRARTGALEDSDVPKLAIDARSRLLARKFASFRAGRPMLTRIIMANLGDIAINFCLSMAGALLASVQPILLNRILSAIEVLAEDTESLALGAERDYHLLALIWAPKEVYQRDVRSAYLFAALSFAAMAMKAHQSVLRGQLMRRVIIRARAEVVGEIYTKALTRIDTSGVVDPKAKAVEGKPDTRAADMGKLVSLVSVDVVRINYAPMILDMLADVPFVIGITAWFLYSLLGYSAFVGYVFLLVVLPYSYLVTTKMMNMQRTVLQTRDLRMRSINELLQSIKFVKFSAWETRWIKRILGYREDELAYLFKFKVVRGLFGLTWNIVPIIIACVNLAWFTGVVGGQLTVAIAFPTILALSTLTSQLNSIPTVFSYYGILRTAIGRIEEFLGEEEVPEWVSSLKRDSESVNGAGQFDTRLGAANASFEWYRTSHKKAEPKGKDKSPAWWKKSPLQYFRKAEKSDTAEEQVEDDATFQLRDINVVFPRGQLSVITGATGSGKSSLLSALLGEMKCLEGRVLLPKYVHRVDPATGLSESVSYCAQHPWLESKTIRENIVFGSSFDQERYNAVLNACVLIQDINQFEDGDATEIGDKGIVLSGGQKARVALARAVYARTRTVILDDVLSAVDTHTASALIQTCFRGPLMRGRTIVLVTHHFASVLPVAAWVVKMDNGRITAQGTVDELRASGDLAELVKTELKEERGQEDTKEEAVALKDNKTAEGVTKPAKKLVENETKARGSVRLEVYAGYFKAASIPLVLLLFAFMFLEDGSRLIQKFWVKVWSESYNRPADWRSPFGFPSASEHVMPYIWVYLALQLTSVALVLSGIFPRIWSSLRASRVLFEKMLDSVVRSPTRYFDKTPAGRILNRFSKDIDSVDGGLQETMNYTASQFISFIIATATVTISIPPFLIALVFLIWLHLYVARGYITASRDLVRLTSTTRSPVVSTFGEVLQGLTTLRAFGCEIRFRDAMFKQLDKFHSAFYLNVVCDYWLRYRFDVLGACTFFVSALIALYLDLSPGLTAIVLVQAQGVVTSIYYGLLFYVMTENSMNGVERIEEYIALPPEPPRHLPDVPAHWPPANADIIYDNVVLRYAPDLEPVLRGVSFTVKAGEKVGIVGRTGSGKSTLAMSLFRFVDPDEGRILVGGMDVTHIGVEDLRARLTLIPQDAVLFSGTIRDNLDPFKEYTDEECLNVLRMVQLPVDAADGGIPADSVPSTSNTPFASGTATPAQTLVTLESKVSAGGANWSAGQRQLIAMARALLRNTGITVLDESTASVDFETDKKIQHTIRAQFKNSILLTIAHRLQTIIDYDRVLVLHEGKIVEFDTPARLIAMDGGVFRGMCIKSEHFAELEAAANAAAESKTSP